MFFTAGQTSWKSDWTGTAYLGRFYSNKTTERWKLWNWLNWWRTCASTTKKDSILRPSKAANFSPFLNLARWNFKQKFGKQTYIWTSFLFRKLWKSFVSTRWASRNINLQSVNLTDRTPTLSMTHDTAQKPQWTKSRFGHIHLSHLSRCSDTQLHSRILLRIFTCSLLFYELRQVFNLALAR